MRATRNGVSLTTNYVTVEKSRQCHTSSTRPFTIVVTIWLELRTSWRSLSSQSLGKY